jgi:hypothetical protein
MFLFRPTKTASEDWDIEYQLYLSFDDEDFPEKINYLDTDGSMCSWNKKVKDLTGKKDHEIIKL